MKYLPQSLLSIDRNTQFNALCFTALLFLSLVLTGCAHLSAPVSMQNKEYANAKSIAPLHIPQGFASSQFQNEYPIPPGQYTASERNVTLVPPGL